MRAFEIYLNGKKLCVAAMNLGELHFSIGGGENRKGRGGVGLAMTGIRLNNEVVRWEQRTLEIGDEVQIKIIESDTADTPEVLQASPRDSRKYEKAYVRRMAKEFGWTLDTSRRARVRKPR